MWHIDTGQFAMKRWKVVGYRLRLNGQSGQFAACLWEQPVTERFECLVCTSNDLIVLLYEFSFAF